MPSIRGNSTLSAKEFCDRTERREGGGELHVVGGMTHSRKKRNRISFSWAPEPRYYEYLVSLIDPSENNFEVFYMIQYVQNISGSAQNRSCAYKAVTLVFTHVSPPSQLGDTLVT